MISACSRALFLALWARQRARRSELAEMSRAISENLLEAFPSPPGASFGFLPPLRDEPDLELVVRAWSRAGARPMVAAPAQRGAPLSFWPWNARDALEPVEGSLWARPKASQPRWPEVVLVPCGLFDERGSRIGHGENLFAGALSMARAQRPSTVLIACAYEFSRVAPGLIAHQGARMDHIATERSCLLAL